MNTTRVLIIALASIFAASSLPVRAEEEKTVKEKTADAWDKTKKVAKETGEVIADKTKEAVAAVEDAIDKPDADAKTVNVQITDKGIEMDQSLSAGKTAFIVKNTGKEKHNFEIEGTNLEKSFWLAISPGNSKTMQVDLKAGTYEVDCKLHGTNEPHVKLTVK